MKTIKISETQNVVMTGKSAWLFLLSVFCLVIGLGCFVALIIIQWLPIWETSLFLLLIIVLWVGVVKLGKYILDKRGL